ncbi:MAG: hypothetical protein KR126chlam3_00550 [Chlamydiae bacterium]|nr:hypothetical protein [Chlamydiota bacterium]
MSTITSISGSSKQEYIETSAPPLSRIPSVEKLSSLAKATLEAKKSKKTAVEEKRQKFWEKYKLYDLDSDSWLVAGDFFSMGYLGFEATQCFIPALKTAAIVQGFSTAFGIIGGIINIVVGLSCIAQGVKLLAKGQKTDGYRLLFDGALLILIGTLMTIGPLLLKLAAGTAVTAALTNPIILPVLFALLSTYITYEVLKKLVPIWRGTDLGTQVMTQIDMLQKTFEKNDAIKLLNTILPKHVTIEVESEDSEDGPQKKAVQSDFASLKQYIQQGELNKVKKILCEVMNRVEEQAGLEATLEMFEMLQQVLELEESLELLVQEERVDHIAHEQMDGEVATQASDFGQKTIEEIHPHQDQQNIATARQQMEAIKEKIRPHKEELAKQLSKWKKIQHVRFLQQILYIGASIASFGTFLPKANADLINGVVNTSMTLANFIPLLLDKLDSCKYYRNVPVTVPGVEPEEITTKI